MPMEYVRVMLFHVVGRSVSVPNEVVLRSDHIVVFVRMLVKVCQNFMLQ